MNTTKHTPGPWKCIDPHVIRDPKNVVVAKTLDSKEGYEIKQANAHLIAAAPAMYEALKALVEYLDTQVQAGKLDDWKHVLVARQALAQAEGK